MKALRKVARLFEISLEVVKSLLLSAKRGHLPGQLRVLYYSLNHGLFEFHKKFSENSEALGLLETPALEKLRRIAGGLHALLPKEPQYSYSILIPVYRPDPEHFRKALRSALNQTAPHFEVLVGFDGEQPLPVYQVVEDLKKQDARAGQLIRTFQFDRTKDGGGISRTTNGLAAEATGKFLLLMDHDDWIRPDLLFRYEQTLRLSGDADHYVLYCNEYKINERDEVIHDSHFFKPEQPVFPYVFINFICHCLMVPTTLWREVGGLRPECDGSQDYDLCLRLDLIGARFQNVPIYLYAWRAHAGSTAGHLGQKDYATPAGIRALTHYAHKRGLDWKISAGIVPTTYRAEPGLPDSPRVHVIILFRDQKDMTLRAVEHALAQKGVELHVTAVDNGSQNLTIGKELRKRGVEVLSYDEPFNFSRLNNAAVRDSRVTGFEHLLILNNDVELESTALREMASWIRQPQIGIVGCRLDYPDGTLQHGGVTLSEKAPNYEITYDHRGARKPWDQTGFARIPGLTDAVTAACCLVRRDVFIQAGGFDELYYPISYSDTDLARRFRRLGYYSFYTPYARGIHYEGKSRGMNRYEDFERSKWLFVQTESRRLSRSGFIQNTLLDPD